MKTLIEGIRLVSLFSFLLVGIIAALNYRKFHRYPARAMAWLIFFNAISEFESYFTALFSIENISHYYVYFLIELVLVPFLISRFSYMSKYKMVIYGFVLVILLASLIEIYGARPTQMNTITRISECIFFVILGVFATAKINDTPRAILRFSLEEFWMCQSIIIYFSIHAIVMLASNYSVQHFGVEFGRKIWMFNSIAAIFSNGLLIWGIWKIYLVKQFFRQ